ncbi:hypothetical protein PTSG_07061 [Salpingoeca rosetta]|uniref:Uncharacterized protein n=1 Tax=Salpingoeca rosetta (strain ATCC 50818 / BSB-021) TaxID=946362 RepID=F2UDY0_SALR5|nr:uncharacterized protein PTSG_07061 [Salpingoeca rosetta]EGD74830.1 hypothetical protein PTSG_07061 [Salpingoeca rosetta]|eukprot:XP_004992475.1 hypothetical protein PTSG_07061 [Salpingoeca rosetta]
MERISAGVETSVLHKAVQAKDYDRIREIIENDEEDIDYVNILGLTPLMSAAEIGDPETVKLLLGLGARKDAFTLSMKTALMFAAAKGNVEAVKRLVEGGADIHAADKGGVSVLHHAVDSENTEVITVLVKAGCRVEQRDMSNGWTPLLRCAATLGRVDVARTLVHLGADVNAGDFSGTTALMLATNHGNVKLVRYLLTAGADKTITTKHGKTAYDFALANRNESLKKLLDHNAPPPDELTAKPAAKASA